MKKILISCLVLILFVGVYGQESTQTDNNWQKYYNNERERVRDSAEFIFEGVVKKMDMYHRIDIQGKDYIATSEIVEITKIFRGNLKPGLVEIAGKINGDIQIPQQRINRKLNSDTIFIFFGRIANEYPYDPKYNIYPVNNNVILTSYSNILGYGISLRSLIGLKKRFKSKGDIYNYIRSFPNITMPFITKEDTVLRRPNHIVKPGSPQRISKAEEDSLNSVRRSKLLEEHKKKHRTTFNKSKSVKITSNLKSTLEQSDFDYVNIDYDGTDYSSDAGNGDIPVYYNSGTVSLTLAPDISLIDDNITNESVAWSSDDPNIATVQSIDASTKEATINVIALGTANIHIKVTFDYTVYDPKTDTDIPYTDGEVDNYCTIDVIKPIPVQGVTIYPTTAIVPNGESQQLTAAISPYNATDQELSWTSSNTSIATVDDGDVLAIKPGTTTITVSTHDGGYTATCSITVSSVSVTGVDVSPKTLVINDATPHKLTATVIPSNATDQLVTWTSSDENIIKVDQHGNLNVIGTGQATITSTTDDGGWTDDCVVTVTPYISLITFSKNGKLISSSSSGIATGQAGDAQTMTINGFGFGTNGNVSFSSADQDQSIFTDYNAFDYNQDAQNCSSCSWTNNQIIMFLPGRVIDYSDKTYKSIGSGNIFVTSDIGEFTDPTPINITHNYLQKLKFDAVGDVTYKYNLKISDNQTILSGKSGISFSIDFPATMNDEDKTDATNCIYRAMVDWSCALTTQPTINPSNGTVISKGYSICITIDPASPNKIIFAPLMQNVLMQTGQDGNIQTSGFNPYDAYLDGTYTITIDNSWTLSNGSSWDYDLPEVTTINGHDFYGSFVHELGHVLQLGHVNTASDLMCYTNSGSGRQHLTSDDLNGAKYIVDQSTNTLGWLHAATTAPCPSSIPPIGLHATNVQSNEIDLQWTDITTGANAIYPMKYVIARVDNPFLGTIVTNTTSFIDYSVSPATTYSYFIVASRLDGSHESYTANYSVTTPAQQPPKVVGSVQVSVPSSGGNPTITWSDNSTNATGYYILVSTTGPNGPYKKVNTSPLSPTTTSYTDITEKPGTVYYYEIESVNSGTTIATTQPIIVASTPCSNTSNINYLATSQIKSFQYTVGTITAGTSVSVASGQNVYFWSGSKVELDPGFTAENGSYFEAEIVACGTTTGYSLLEKDSIKNDLATNINEPNVSSPIINIYPNPNNGSFTVSLTNEAVSEIAVVNMFGQQVQYSTNNNAGSLFSITLPNGSKGMYFVRLKGKQKTYLQKIVVE